MAGKARPGVFSWIESISANGRKPFKCYVYLFLTLISEF